MKRKRAEEIGSELYADGGLDAMENIWEIYSALMY